MKQIGLILRNSWKTSVLQAALILPFVLFFSCETAPTHSELEFLLDILEADELISLAPPPEPPEPSPQTSVPSEEFPSEELPSEEQHSEEPPSEELILAGHAFDPDNVSNELYESTKTEIQDLIQRLDNIIRARNYNAWLGYLSESYRSTISSAAFLEERTEELHRRDQLVAAATGKDPRSVEKKVLRTLRDYFDHVVVPSRANDRVDDIAFISETEVRAYTVNNRGTRLILYDLGMIGGTWKIIG